MKCDNFGATRDYTDNINTYVSYLDIMSFLGLQASASTHHNTHGTVQ